MNSARVMAFGSVLIIAVLLAGTWFLGVSPKLTDAAKANTDRAAVETQNAAHQAAVAALKEQSENLPALQADLDELRAAVPGEAALPELISQLNRNAIAHGVTITSLTVADPVPYLVPPEVAEDSELAAASASLSADNFLTIGIGLDLTGTFDDVMAFVSDLQSGERLYLVHALDLVEGAMEPEAVVTLSTTGQVFVLLEKAPAAPTGEVPEAEATE